MSRDVYAPQQEFMVSTSVFVTFDDGRPGICEVVAGAGAGERFWMPIIERCELDLMEAAFSGGLTISEGHYHDFVEQVRQAVEALSDVEDGTSGAEDAVGRGRKLLQLLETFRPGEGVTVYVG